MLRQFGRHRVRLDIFRQSNLLLPRAPTFCILARFQPPPPDSRLQTACHPKKTSTLDISNERLHDVDHKSQRQFILWTAAWVVPFVGVSLAMRNDWITNDALAVVAIVGVTILGLGTLLAFRQFLNNTDELMRKIQLDALALAVGAGVVSSFSLSLLERAKIVADAEPTTVVLVMSVAYVVGVVAGLRRFA